MENTNLINAAQIANKMMRSGKYTPSFKPDTKSPYCALMPATNIGVFDAALAVISALGKDHSEEALCNASWDINKASVLLSSDRAWSTPVEAPTSVKTAKARAMCTMSADLFKYMFNAQLDGKQTVTPLSRIASTMYGIIYSLTDTKALKASYGYIRDSLMSAASALEA